jgi:hypothetical protein
VRGSLAAAWLIGEGIVIWRYTGRNHRIPPPGVLLGITGLFAALGLLADFQATAGIAVAAAWGLDVAALMSALPAGLAGQVTKTQAGEAKATGQAAPSGG